MGGDIMMIKCCRYLGRAVLTMLLLVAACSEPGSDRTGCAEPTPAMQPRCAAFDRNLNAIGGAFAKSLPLASEFSRSCVVESGASNPLQGYLDALRARDSEAALMAIAELHDVASCYDDHSFQGLAAAFESAALRHATDRLQEQEDLAVALAPAALLLLDDPRIAPGPLRIGYGDWFRRHGERTARAMHYADTPFPKVGLIVAWGDSIIQMPPDKATLLLESLAHGSFLLLDCRVEDLVAVEDGAEKRLVCLKSCPGFETLLEDLTPEERAEVRSGFPEYARLCDEVNSALDGSARLRSGVLSCVREYLDQTDSGAACVAERLAAARGPESLFERVRDLGRSPSIEVLKNRKRCLVSQLSPEERRRYEELTDKRRKIVETIERHKDEIARIDDRIRRVRQNIAVSKSTARTRPWVPWCWGGSCQRDLQQLQDERQEQEEAIDELVDDLQDTNEEWEPLNQRYRSSTTRNCPPGIDGCGDACGLASELENPLVECLFQEGQELPGDDPIRQPDPRDPFDPDDPALRALSQCIDQAIGESRPGIEDCPSVPDCPDPHVRPLGDAISEEKPRRDCSCTRELRAADARNERLCGWIAMPDPLDPSRFTCPELGENPAGASQGSEGGLGGPDPEVFFEIQLGADVLGRVP